MVQEQSALVRLLVEAGELEPRPPAAQHPMGSAESQGGLIWTDGTVISQEIWLKFIYLNGDSYSTNNPVWWNHLNQLLSHGGFLAWQTGSRRTSHELAKKWEVYIACIPRIHLMIIYDHIPNKANTISYSIIKVYHLIELKYRDHIPNEQFQSCLIFWSEWPLCRKKNIPMAHCRCFTWRF